MSSFEKEKRLVRSLAEKTAAGKLEWTEDMFGDPEVKIGDHTVLLEEGRAASGSTLIFVILKGSDGKEIDRFHDEDLDTPAGDGAFFRILSELYSRATRQAKGAEQVIDDILKGIDGL